jgi:hypothetical protein
MNPNHRKKVGMPLPRVPTVSGPSGVGAAPIADPIDAHVFLPCCFLATALYVSWAANHVRVSLGGTGTLEEPRVAKPTGKGPPNGR